jgi:hypothetical protein
MSAYVSICRQHTLAVNRLNNQLETVIASLTAGNQFTCFTGTKVQILTLSAIRTAEIILRIKVQTGTEVQILTPSAVCTAEIGLRIYGHGPNFFLGPNKFFNLFDLSVVVLSIGIEGM